jgi:hypothetical protein
VILVLVLQCCLSGIEGVIVALLFDVRVALQGLGTGAVILFASSGKHSRVLQFSEDLFFIYLLPPIIFNAGYGILAIDAICSSVMVPLFYLLLQFIGFSYIKDYCYNLSVFPT